MMNFVSIFVNGIVSLLTVDIAYRACASTPRVFQRQMTALEGENVEIPCVINDLSRSEIVIWQNGSMVLSSGWMVYLPPGNDKVSLVGDKNTTFNLILKRLTIYDEADYSCQVPGRAVYHNLLTVNVPASILFIPDTPSISLVEETELKLECYGFGKPKPSIKWTFHGPEGPIKLDQYRNQTTLKVKDVRQTDAGIYECTADNGVQIPPSHTIDVVVEFSPSVIVTSPVVHVTPGQAATIECRFIAKPDVEVEWYHNMTKMNFQRLANVVQSHNKVGNFDVWRLDITNLLRSQLGNYTCYGENGHGKVFDTVYLSPVPYDLKFLSEHEGRYTNRYTLRWQVSSQSELVEFLISMKQLNDTYDTEWHNFSIPVVQTQIPPLHAQEYTFQRLEPNATYVVLIQARNQYGYSNWANGLTFHTALVSKGVFMEPAGLLVIVTSLLLLTITEILC